MPRQWGPTGVVDSRPVEIDAAGRQQINLELKDKGYTKEVPEAFFEALGHAIGSYHSGKELAESSKPANVRNNLKEAIDAAHTLNDRLNDLDGNSRQLLSQIEDTEISTLQNVHLWKIIHTLSEASHLADEYPSKGRLYEYHRLWLAVDIADAITTHLGVDPTTTKEGLFESILTIVLEMVTDKEILSVHDLVCKALKANKLKHSNGLTEYIPPKDD